MDVLKILRFKGYLLIALCLPVLLLSASLAWGFNSQWLYNFGFEKYQVSQATGLPPTELNKTAAGLINYFNSDEEYISLAVTAGDKTFELFTTEEKIHFKDVKELVRLDYKIFFITLAIVVIIAFLLVISDFRQNWRDLAKSFMWGSILSIVFIIIVAIASFFNFENLFLQFHYLAFTNDYWSAEGYMLLLFPGEFWYNAAFFCLGMMAGLSLIWGSLSFMFIKLDERRNLKTH